MAKRKRTVNVDEYCKKLLAENPNALVSWYMMTSYLYYIKDMSVITDDTYDNLCKRLSEEWDEIKHPHKHLIDLFALRAGTGFYLKEEQYPPSTVGAAERLIDPDWKPS